MKRLISLLVVVAFAGMAYSQSIPAYDKSKLLQSKQAEYQRAGDYEVIAPVKEQDGPRAFAPDESIIGNTLYDLQTNKALQNRIYRYDDGQIGAVWTMGMESPGFFGRGAGYNFYDGSAWGPAPTTRVETIKTGWPSYSPLGVNGELIISHDFGASTLIINQRENKGTGDWSESVYTYTSGPDELSWPRHITAGTNNESIHLMVNSVNEYMGMTSAQVYSRSTDGGASWDIENIIIDGMGVDDYLDLAADEVVWADPVDNNIAFLCLSAWHDMFMMKSTDNGDTWEKTIIWEHPYPFFDWNVTITDTFFCVDQSASIALAPDGKAHVAFGISRVAHFEVGATYTYWPLYEGIGYWNEDMDAFSGDVDALAPPQYGYANSEMVEDYNYIGWMQDVDGDGEITLTDEIMSYRSLGPCTMPSIIVDDWGNIIVLYSATTETYFNDTYNYKHIWARAYYSGSETWLDFYDLTEDIVHIFDECIYPQMASKSGDNHIYYMYNADTDPGLALDDNHSYGDNREVFAILPKPDLGLPPVGIEEDLNGYTAVIVSQNFPNPANSTTSISVDLENASQLSLELCNIVGQTVLTMDKGYCTAGMHLFTMDASDLDAGTYFYTVMAGEKRITKRMIIN